MPVRERDSHIGGTALLPATLALFMLSACGARDSDQAGGLSSAPADPPAGELLIASPPAGWQEIRGINRGRLRIAEYAAPAAADGDDPIDQIRFESTAGDPLPDPIEFVAGMSGEFARQCSGFEDFPIFSGYENGYPTAVRLLFCHSQGSPPRSEVRMVKAIQGNEQFYTITRSRRGVPLTDAVEPLSTAEMADWSGYFSAIGLCDTRDTSHACPGAETLEDDVE